MLSNCALIYNKSKPDNREDWPDKVNHIWKYSYKVKCSQGRIRRYIIEIHQYGHVAMIKFSPRNKKNEPNKFKIRGIKNIGWQLNRYTLLELLYICYSLMTNYLDHHPENYIGYIGQVDDKDDENEKVTSQRSDVYNILLSSMLLVDNRYKFIKRNTFDEINMRLIRKNNKKDNTQTALQIKHYTAFIKLLEENADCLYELMTTERRKQVLSRSTLR